MWPPPLESFGTMVVYAISKLQGKKAGAFMCRCAAHGQEMMEDLTQDFKRKCDRQVPSLLPTAQMIAVKDQDYSTIARQKNDNSLGLRMNYKKVDQHYTKANKAEVNAGTVSVT
ncbi:hypothetical protein MUK42_33572 [Musa troglodytarum]|uniref:Uncharacterized protein n=1 Tax=Musa troglodytarum TaxID=320322 RepID=A0A9E7FEP6_9LILI|nr:hypothetical protein MUK42_33572 [Musa troglodytarum]